MITGGKPVTDEANETLGADDLADLKDQLESNDTTGSADGRSSGDGR